MRGEVHEGADGMSEHERTDGMIPTSLHGCIEPTETWGRDAERGRLHWQCLLLHDQVDAAERRAMTTPTAQARREARRLRAKLAELLRKAR